MVFDGKPLRVSGPLTNLCFSVNVACVVAILLLPLFISVRFSFDVSMIFSGLFLVVFGGVSLVAAVRNHGLILRAEEIEISYFWKTKHRLPYKDVKKTGGVLIFRYIEFNGPADMGKIWFIRNPLDWHASISTLDFTWHGREELEYRIAATRRLQTTLESRNKP